jgi:diguanylate cyclase (GGDEF)-like protein
MWRIPQNVVAAGSDDVVLQAGTEQLKDPQGFYDRVIRLYEHPEEVGHDEIEFKDGRVFDRYSAPLYDSDRKYLGRVWFFRDITTQKQAEAELRHTSRHDGLTGLANRRVFMEGVKQAIARAERGDRGFAVLFLDLDHFKDVNDTLGHPTGDDLLCAIADRLRVNARATDLVARFGGDEFAVIAAAIGEPADAANLADKIVAAIGNSFSIHGNNIHSSVSIGIAVYEPGGADAETLLAHADVALYRAKADGRSGYRFFTNTMDVEVRARVIMSGELREAIASGQLFLRYQPQIEAQTGRIVGVEALVRWNHPLRGVLLPGDFIQVAEKAGLSVALDRWVGREACRQARDWLDEHIEPVVMSVNVSGAQFKRPIELEDDVALVLEKSGLPPHLLELELTETVLMEASDEHNEVLARLRKSGVRLAIDDFGTGYSSLDYLRRYPADRVKIAQDFVRQIAIDPGSAAIVRATIALARELGMVAIAEGVETREQFELLKAWGCTQMQGFYFAKPLAPEDVLPLLLRGRILEPTATLGKAAA